MKEFLGALAIGIIFLGSLGHAFTIIHHQPIGGGGGATLTNADARSVGFTTLVVDMDFSTGTYSNRANFVDLCGADVSGAAPSYPLSLPLHPKIFVGGIAESPNVNCNAVNVVTDTDGIQSLRLDWKDAYLPQSPNSAVDLQLSNYLSKVSGSDGRNGLRFPNFGYWEVKFRSNIQDLPGNSGAGNNFWFHNDSWPCPADEWDSLEYYASSGGSSTAQMQGCGGFNCIWCQGNWPNIDYHQYHTWGTLVTGDDNAMWDCRYIDGQKYGCEKAPFTPSQNENVWYIADAGIYGGDCRTNWSPTSNACILGSGVADSVWLRSFRYWACPSPQLQVGSQGSRCMTGSNVITGTSWP